MRRGSKFPYDQGMWWSTTNLYFQIFQHKYTKSLERHEQFEDLEGHEPVDQAFVTCIGLCTVQYHSLAFMAHSFPKQ